MYSTDKSLDQHLSDPSLIKSKLFINGQWRDSRDGATRAVIDPATGKTTVEVAMAT